MSRISPASILYDAAGNAVGVLQDGAVYRLQTEAQLATGAKVQLTDGTHDAEVTSDGRLLVSAGRSAKGRVCARLVDSGGDFEMAVDGDPTPAVFEWNPGSVAVDGVDLSLIMEDGTIKFGDKFGGITGPLDNGLLLEVKAEDAAVTLYLFKRTRELLQCSVAGGFDLYAAIPDILRAEFSLEGFRFMPSGTYATDDYVRATVQDDIDGLDHLSIVFHGVEVV